MSQRAAGTFEVKMTPQPPDAGAEDPGVGRMALDKVFHGDLEATSAGLMLSIGTEVPNSAGYVAMERVTGALHGRRGSFALQHSGTLNRGAPSLTVQVVPDSGAGALTGLAGTLDIQIDAHGGHRYALDYTLP